MTKKVNVDLITEFRKANKLTIEKFCEKSNIGATTYRNIIKESRASVQTLFGIARAMNISVTQLFN